MAEPGLVVVGSGPAGIAAATGYRDAGGSGAVLVLTSDDELPYERPPLSKDFLEGTVPAQPTPLNEAGYYAAHDIELRLQETVAALDPADRTLVTTSGATIDYTACVLATGSTPTRLPVPGADLPAVHLLRSMTDARRLRTAAARARRAVVVGSGFIGCEAAASLARRGVAVTLISPELLPQRTRLDEAAGQQIADWLRADGVELGLGQSLASITEADGVTTVHTDTDASIETDLVVMAGGVSPAVELARDAGLVLAGGRVQVDEHMRTSAPDVFAAGDIAYAFNPAAGRHLGVEHWGEALTMGEIAGRCAAGDGEARWAAAPGFWSTIGGRTLKYVAWGDGFESSRLTDRGDGAFSVSYARQGRIVGVLTHDADDEYEAGTARVENAEPDRAQPEPAPDRTS